MKIKNSYSKEGQDKLAKYLIGNQGFFLDIGCSNPKNGNNTFLLEELGWKGLLIDHNQKYVELCKKERKSDAFKIDCNLFTRENWIDFLEKNNAPKIIDYMSVDVDGSNINFIRNFPLEKYEFKIMTYETDVYRFGKSVKNAAIEILSKFNFYKILLEDGMIYEKEKIWEDWWVNEKYIKCQNIYSKKIKWSKFLEKLEYSLSNIRLL